MLALKRRHRFISAYNAILGGATPLYTISGTVYDSDGTTAVASATVALGSYSATSAGDGTYTISAVPAGTSGSMTCTKAGYSWTAKTISAMSGNLTAQNYTNAWWAYGGISANCLAAFQPFGAASYAASKVNLTGVSANDAADGAAYPGWAANTGWAFTAESSQYLTVGSGAIVADQPLTMACLFKAINVEALQPLMAVSDADQLQRLELDMHGALAGDPVVFRARGDNGSLVSASTSTGATENSWHTAICVASAANARAAYIDGGSKGTNTTSLVLQNADTTTIGALLGSSPAYATVIIAACSFYNTAPNDASVAKIDAAMRALVA